MDKEIIELLQAAAKQLGVAVEYIYPLLVQRMFVTSIVNVVFLL